MFIFKKDRSIGWLTFCVVFMLSSGCGDERSNKTSSETDLREYSGDKFTANIRITEALTPEEERVGFRLPEGFEINLFASEPDIGKPMNLSFDSRGRVWVTQSSEYPFPAAPGEGKDKLIVLEDTDGDGKADKFTTFSDTLNIPIGLLPVSGGAVVYSIPNIYKYSDSDGSGKANQQQKLFGPFKTRDTHGMINNFVRGYDGWIHACHGFTNRDTIMGTDGHAISMISGNTFRFRMDGSRVEKTTDGRINPFGLVYDEMGYLYSTDCHTSPLYQLISGADYPQWGKEDKMGYAPDMTPLSDEATALAGIAYYADVLYPKNFQHNFFVGDVVRSRVCRYSPNFRGSTPVGKKEEDFVLSKDPWFRPVDVKMGPDGAIYIADFYNPIIGHYEVPLDHPQRDHTRGRIWRITYKGKTNKTRDLAAANMEELLKALDAANMFVRMSASDELADRIGNSAVEPVKSVIKNTKTSARQFVHALWVLQRLGGLGLADLQHAARHKEPLIRLHAFRIIAERDPNAENFFPMVEAGLQDSDPHVRRAAAGLLGRYPTMNSVKLALEWRKKTAPEETHLLYTLRLNLRDMLRNDALMKEITTRSWEAREAGFISDVLTDVPTSEAAKFLLQYVIRFRDTEADKPLMFKHMVRYIPTERIDSVVQTAMLSGYPDSVNMPIFYGLQQGLAQRGTGANRKLESWGKSIAESVLQQTKYEKEEKGAAIEMQIFASELAGHYRIETAAPSLKLFLKDIKTSDLIPSGQAEVNKRLVALKVAAARALLRIDSKEGLSIVRELLNNSEANGALKVAIAQMLGEFPAKTVNDVLRSVKNASPELQSVIALNLAATGEGKDILFTQVQNNNFYPRVLLNPKTKERIMLGLTLSQKRVYERLTANVDAIDPDKEQEINERVRKYEAAAQDKLLTTDSGHLVFIQNCAACHTVAEEGGQIGPNLDGITQWSVKSLAEKILDPNRNISENFKNYILTMKDGRILNGLYRREEGSLVIFADIGGQEFSIPKKEIAKQTSSKITLMPDNFGERLSEHEFNALIYFLVNPKNSKP